MSAIRWHLGVALAVLTTVAGGRLVAAEVEQPTDKLIAQLEAKAKPAQSVKADTKMSMSMMGQKVTMRGTLLFKKPRKSRMEMSMQMGSMKMDQIMISDGTTVWTYQPTLNMANKINLVKLQAETGLENAGQHNTGDIAKPFGGFDPKTIKPAGTEVLDGVKTYAFEGSPKTAELPQGFPFRPAKIKVWVGADDGQLRQMVMFDKDGKQMMSQTYDHVQLNVPAPDSQFEFAPPKGVQVRDMTEGVIKMFQQMKKAKPAKRS